MAGRVEEGRCLIDPFRSSSDA